MHQEQGLEQPRRPENTNRKVYRLLFYKQEWNCIGLLNFSTDAFQLRYFSILLSDWPYFLFTAYMERTYESNLLFKFRPDLVGEYPTLLSSLHSINTSPYYYRLWRGST
jgi:hypothetical protein